jgi:hypothetical protein
LQQGGWVSYFQEKNIILSLLKGAVLFFLIFGLFCLFFYALGAGQGFTDKTQNLLLRIMTDSGIALAIFSVCAFFFSLPRVIHSPRIFAILGIGVYLILCALGILAALFASFITAAAEGNTGGSI